MPFNGSGVYTLVAGNPVVTGTTIQSTWANSSLSDLAAALSNVLVRDGQAAMTGTLNMGTQSISNATNITATGTVSIGTLVLTAATVPANGWYLSTTNTIAAATASTVRLTINATGNVVIAAPSSGVSFAATALSQGTVGSFTDGTVTAQLGFSASAAQIGASSNHGFNLFTNNTARLSIGNDGRITVAAPTTGTAVSISASVTGASAINLTDGTAIVQLPVGVASGASGIGTSTAHAFNLFTSGTNRISIAATGQASVYEPLNSINAQKNAATYETGSFTGTLTGCTTSPTATFNYSRNGNTVTIDCTTALTATSNATTCTITGVPATLSPVRSGVQLCRVVDNGTSSLGNCGIAAASTTITLALTAAAGGVFTASGTKGLSGWYYTYNLT